MIVSPSPARLVFSKYYMKINPVFNPRKVKVSKVMIELYTPTLTQHSEPPRVPFVFVNVERQFVISLVWKIFLSIDDIVTFVQKIPSYDFKRWNSPNIETTLTLYSKYLNNLKFV